MRSSTSMSWTISSTSPVRISPDGRKIPACRPRAPR
jgi:hypothetical protein